MPLYALRPVVWTRSSEPWTLHLLPPHHCSEAEETKKGGEVPALPPPRAPHVRAPPLLLYHSLPSHNAPARFHNKKKQHHAIQ